MPKLEVEHVSVRYGERTIIKDISLNLRQGELVCLLGASGVGKTTLFNVIAGLIKPQDGKVILNGKDVTEVPGRISYMLQKDLMLPFKTVIDNVALPLRIKGIGKKESRAKAETYFEIFGLEGTQALYPIQLSGGMRQRAAMLRTYLFSEEVALLDEPFSALDTMTKGKLHAWYLDIMEQIKLSTLFITHDIDEAILLSDRIYIMKGNPGKISHELSIDTKRPRGEIFMVSQDFMTYKKQILEILHDE